MKFRGLLVAVALLAALGGAAYWSNKKEKTDASKPPADAPPKILNIPSDQFKEIDLKKKSGESTDVMKIEGKWQIMQPKPLPADQDSVGSLVSSLSSLTSDRLIEDKAGDLSQYGLNAPSQEVKITQKDGKAATLLLGDDTPTGSGVFARLDNDPRIFIVASYVKSSLDKTSNDLRDKRLLTFDSDKLTRVELMAKGTIEFGKNNQNEWQILKPRPLRADGLQVDELVRKLKDAKMDVSSSDADAAKKTVLGFGSGTRVAVASVSDARGTQQLEVRKDKDKNYWAKSSGLEGAFKA